MALSQVGTLSYNGITFDAFHRSTARATPVWDEAGRTITHVEWQIDVVWPVQASGSALDTVMELYRTALMTPAQTLVYSNKGLSTDFSVGPSGTFFDVEWGPKPLYLELVAWGDHGGILKWGVSCKLPYCASTSSGGSKYKNNIMAANYEVSYDIDEEGLTSLTTSGYIEVPNTRYKTGDAGRPVTFSADSFRPQIRPEVPVGFQRVAPGRFKLSKDKRRLDFTFVDRELHFPLPDNCVAADIEHTVEGDNFKGFQNWRGSITATITTAAGVTKATAFDRFMLVVASRLRKTPAKGDVAPRAQQIDESFIWLRGIGFREQVLTRQSSFFCRYEIINSSLTHILGVSKLWTPVTGTNFNSWKTSLDNGPWRARGNAGLAFGSTEDVIIDLCSTRKQPPAGDPTQQPNAGQNDAGAKGKAAQGAQLVKPEASWVNFKMGVEMHVDGKVIRHKPLTGAAKTSVKSPVIDAFKTSKQQGATGKTTPQATSTVADGVQRVAGPSTNIVLYGYAERISYAVPVPSITSVGGQGVVLKNEYVNSYVSSAVGGLPVNRTEWRLEYMVPLGPNALTTPANLQFNTPALSDSTNSNVGIEDPQ
jgi:hypothetical protein